MEIDCPTAAAIYTRISEDRENDQLGVTRQREDCLELAIRKGWPITAVYSDDDISAYRGKVRPSYRKMLSDIADGVVDAVIVWHLDRLHRHPRELEEFFDVCSRAGVRHLASVTGDVDLGTHDGQFMARILGAVARKESDDKSRRIARKHLELARAGKPAGGGHRPYGYDKDWVTVCEQEAAILREAADRVLGGEPIRSIARSFNQRVVPTVSGRPWSSSRIVRMVTAPRVAGLREHKGEILGDAVWPAIIPREQWEQLRAFLMDPRRKTYRPAREYVLTGTLRCGWCGTRLVSAPRREEGHGFRCIKGPALKGCGRLRISSRYLDDFVRNAVCHRFDTPLFASSLAEDDSTQDDASVLMTGINADEAQLDQLAARWANRDIGEREWLIARDAIQSRLVAARSKLKAIDRNPLLRTWVGKGDELLKLWPDKTLHEKRAILHSILEAIYVEPAPKSTNRFNPARLRPVWRV